MKHSTRILTAALVGALAVAPAAAQAHSQPTTKSVKSHVRSADDALEMVESLVAQNADAAAAVQFARNRSQMKAARREAARLGRRVQRVGRPGRASAAQRTLALQYDANADAFVQIVEQVTGEFQALMARAAVSDLRARELAVETLTALLGQVPAQARPVIAQVIAALSAGGEAEVTAIAGVLAGGTLPPEAEAALQTALGLATAAVGMSIEQLNGIVGMVPAQARPQVEFAIGLATKQLAAVQELLAGLFAAPGAGGSPVGLPGLSGALCIPIKLPLPLAIPSC